MGCGRTGKREVSGAGFRSDLRTGSALRLVNIVVSSLKEIFPFQRGLYHDHGYVVSHAGMVADYSGSIESPSKCGFGPWTFQLPTITSQPVLLSL